MEVEAKASTSEVKAEEAKASTPEVKKTEVQYVTVEEFARLKKRADDQSAIIDELRKAKTTNAAKDAEPAKTPEVTEQVKELQAFKKGLEDRERSLNEKQTLKEIEAALIEGGVKPALAKDKAKLISLEHSGKFKVTDDGVKFVVSETEEHKAGEYIKNVYLQTDAGKEYIAPKKNPVANMAPGNKTHAGDIVVYTSEDFRRGNFDNEIIKAGKFKVKD